jgi:hypothetical protein
MDNKSAFHVHIFTRISYNSENGIDNNKLFYTQKGLINSIEIYLEGEVHEIISQNIKTKRLFCFLIL